MTTAGLTALDATFLELEDADETAHMHIGATLVFEADGDAPTIEDLRSLVVGRLQRLPHYLDRLSERHTHGLRWPAWRRDDDFDVSRHVYEAALPMPATDAELHEWAARFWSQRVDRAHPLWEIVLVRDLAGSRWALITKTHHCLVDGVGSIDVAHLLLDVEPSPPRGSDPPSAGDIPERTTARQVGDLLGAPLRAGRQIAHEATHPRELLDRSRSAVSLIVRDEIVAAPRTSLNVPLTTSRRYASAELGLADVKAVAHTLGGTVNDVVLSLVTGALRELLLERGDDLPAHGVRAMVPVNIRSEADRLAMGNRISSLFVELPVAIEPPLQRFYAVHERAVALKRGGQGRGSSTIIGVAGLAPPVLHASLARTLYASRLFNITVTNVPGPQLPLYCLGARLRSVLPLVPLAAEHALGVAIVSYDGRLFFGLVGDRDAVPELGHVAEAITDGMQELLDLVNTQPTGRSRMASDRTPTEQPPAKSTTGYLQDALKDLDRARERAGEEAREGIDKAVDQIRQAVRSRTEATQEELGEWREALEHAGEDVRREIGFIAIRVQDSPDTLKEIAAEARRRRSELMA